MLAISTARTLVHVLTAGCDPGLLPILKRYQPLMADGPLARLFVLHPGDRMTDLEESRGRPFQLWEFIEAQDGWYEAVFVLSDDGFGHVVLIPDSDDTDPHLLTICRENAAINC